MNQILISIITPTFNSSSTIQSVYDSLLKQSYTNWEWVVTDDCSDDDTISILSSIAKNDSRVRVFINNINSGAAVSRNNSIKNAKGDYIAFIDSDDLWFPEKLEYQLRFMISNMFSFSFTAYEIIDENGMSINKIIDLQGDNLCFSYDDMLKKKATLGCSTVMLKVRDFTELSMPLIRTGQDYALWLKLLKGGVKAHLYNGVMTKYRLMPGSISRNKIKKAARQWQIYRKIERLNLIFSFYCFLNYSYRAFFRR